MTRDQFVKSLAAGYAGTSLGFAANETIGVGLIGVGGRTRHLLGSLSQLKGVKITAVCDVWDTNLAKGKSAADPMAAATKDYRALLDRKDVDGVLIGTPDHQHVPMAIAACQAGKDVYVEKPLTHSMAEGSAIVEAQRRSGRIVQVGMQHRSMPHIQKARDLVRSGVIGRVSKVHLTWNRNHDRWVRPPDTIDPAAVDWSAWLGPAPRQPFDEYRFRGWRWFWDFGGGIFTDLMVHWIDVAHWFFDFERPDEAHSIGDHLATKGLWQTPDTVQTLLRYSSGPVQAYFEGTFVNARNAAMIEFMGTDGTLYIDRGRYELYPEQKRANFASPPAPPKFAYTEWVLGDGPRGADFYAKPNGELLHLANWLECIRSRKTPNAPVEAGVSAAAAAHLANQALRSGVTARVA